MGVVAEDIYKDGRRVSEARNAGVRCWEGNAWDSLHLISGRDLRSHYIQLCFGGLCLCGYGFSDG